MDEDETVLTAPQPPPTRGGVGPRRALLVSVVGILALLGIVAVFILVFRSTPSDLDEYFEDAGAVLNTVNERTSEGDYGSTGPLLVHLSTVLRNTSETLDGINAPDEVGEAHSALIEALEEEAVLLGSLSSEDLEADTSEELSTFLAEHEELGVIVRRVTQSCSELKTVAEENEIEVELGLC